MKAFVTGASGWIGSAVLPELLGAGHEVVGLARSDSSAAAVVALGGQPHRGSLDDLESLRSGARGCDAVVHLGYDHDFSQMERSAQMDRAAIDALGQTLEGTGAALLIASGTMGLRPGGVGTERDMPDAGSSPRVANALATLAYADRGVRSGVIRFAPTVHGRGDHGFVATLVGIARDRGVSAYVGDGSSRWPAVHRSDAARLVRLAVESAPAGSVLHAVAEQGVPARDIAAAIGSGLGLPVTSVAAGDAYDHFGWMSFFFGQDIPATHELTSELLGWQPTAQGLLEDLAEGHYF